MTDWSTDLIAETAKNPTTLCRLFIITPVEGAAMRFTDHDTTLTVDGDEYRPDHSFDASAIENSIGGANQNLEITVLFTDALVSYAKAVRGFYQGATVQIYLCSWSNVAAGKGLLMAGNVGSLSIPSKLYGVLSLVGGSGKMARSLTEVYTPTCRADFGDARCGKNINDFKQTFTVTAVAGQMAITVDHPGTDGQFNLGSVVWASGGNTGVAQEVAASHADGGIDLFYSPPFDIAVGDTGTLYQGCAKTLAACIAYNNLVNFRGEPYVPGDDYAQVT